MLNLDDKKVKTGDIMSPKFVDFLKNIIDQQKISEVKIKLMKVKASAT
jgi:hypothetical protein